MLLLTHVALQVILGLHLLRQIKNLLPLFRRVLLRLYDGMGILRQRIQEPTVLFVEVYPRLVQLGIFHTEDIWFSLPKLVLYILIHERLERVVLPVNPRGLRLDFGGLRVGKSWNILILAVDLIKSHLLLPL